MIAAHRWSGWKVPMALGLAGTVAMGAAGTMEATPARNAARTSSQGAEHRPPGGRIEGTVTISEKIVARRPAFRIYADAGPGSQPPPAPRPDSIAELQNVVIYLDGEVSGDAVTARTGRATMTQHDERFSPHVLPIVRGDTVDFPNQDPYFHNVFSLSRAPREFDLGRYPKGESKFEAFTKTGIVEVFCHIHSNMSGIILVLGNRFFSVPTSNGRFALDGVPAGDYTVVGWHERINPVQHRVHVTEGGVAKVDFNIPLTSGG